MPVFLSDKILDRLERSSLYMVFDLVFEWIGLIGMLCLIGATSWVYWSDHALPKRLWLLGVLAIGLLMTAEIKDWLIAWFGIAPPDHSKWFGPKQLPPVVPSMDAIIEAQGRAGRIRARGYFVDELLNENEARFKRNTRSTREC
jgi:hypothetical protein